jgi:ABC-type multidrug transport system fused ATPase/permease subunit
VVLGENPAGLFVVLAYMYRITAEVFAVQTHWQSFVASIGSIEAVEDELARGRAHAEPRGSRPVPATVESLACERVSFHYRAERPVLVDVDVMIPARSTVAFVGESGSGKSTLVDILTGTLRPQAGRVLVNGHDLADLDVEELRHRIGYVPQETVLFDDTVANNISMWDEGGRERLADAAQRARALGFIEATPEGFETQIGDRGIKLSGGQRQRLAIARELYRGPEILVLDEATSALDSESERAIQESIDALRGKMTILIIAHRISTIRNCDRLYVLHQGQIVEQGSYQELLARPASRFRRMCELQNLIEYAAGAG